jgi:hypothetical protein
VGKDDLSLEAAVLTTDLEFLRVHFDYLQIRVLSLDELDSLGKLLGLRHSGRGEDGQPGRIV